MSRRLSFPEPLERLIAPRRRPHPPPRVEVVTGSTVHAWALRLMMVAALAGALALVTRSQGHWLVAVALLAGIAARPDGIAPALFVGGLGLLVLTGPADPWQARVFLLVFAVHLAVELGAVAGALPVEARVEWRVLARAVPVFLGVQAVAQTLALLGAWVAGQPPAMPWLPLVAAAGVAVLSWAVTSQLRDQT